MDRLRGEDNWRARACEVKEEVDLDEDRPDGGEDSPIVLGLPVASLSQRQVVP